MPPKKTHMSDAAIEAMIAQGVVDALPDYEVNRGSRNGHDNHNLGIGEGRTSHTARFEKIESIFHISSCTVECQIKYVTCTLLGSALTWWNSHVKTIGHDAAYEMPSRTLMKMMTACIVKSGKYRGGLPDMIQGNVMSSKPKMMQEAIKFANDLIDQKIPTFTERQAKKKRKLDNNPRDNQAQQQPFKRQNVARAYTVRPGEKKEYGGTLPFLHQSGNSEAHGRAYALEGDKENPDSNLVTGTFLLNNRYASILFDTDADRSFVSTAFSSLIDIIPTTLNIYYDVELADGKITGVNTIIRGCTLNFLNHPFNIDLMPIELGSFDIIIGMDWLSLYYTVIVYDEKIVHVPFGNETLIIRGDGSNHGNESRLNIISYTKTHKYLLKGCHVFLAHITKKKTEEKSEEKRLENVPIVRDFLKVFPEDLLRVPPTR
ncbi:putative reverse transcriptase domain-containing protein [Tanacetum coccineum]